MAKKKPLGYSEEELTPEAISKLSFLESDDLRSRVGPDNKIAQNLLAPHEHALYNEGVVRENPLTALPLSIYTPAYSLFKQLGLIDTRSDASLEEMKQGYVGIGNGLRGFAEDSYSNARNYLANLYSKTMSNRSR
jgi:hypothetical protein